MGMYGRSGMDDIWSDVEGQGGNCADNLKLVAV